MLDASYDSRLRTRNLVGGKSREYLGYTCAIVGLLLGDIWATLGLYLGYFFQHG